MSEHTPASATPPPPPPPPPAAPAATGGKGGKGKYIAGGIGAVLIGGAATAGVIGYNTLSGGGPQPSDVLPASTQMYARIDLDPGASQKIELFKLLNKVPELKEWIGVDDPNKADIRELIFGDLTEEVCPDIDYEDDIEPWLGDRVGLGLEVRDIQSEDVSVVIAVQVKDNDAATNGIDALFECADEDYGIAFYDEKDYVLLSDTQDHVDDALDAAKEKSLSENDNFISAMDALGEKGVASAWFDAESFVDIILEIPGFEEEIGTEELEEARKAGSIATALRVDGSAIEIAGVSSNTVETFDGKSNIADLPDDTIAAVSVSGVGPMIEEQWDFFLDSLESEFDSEFSDDDFYYDDSDFEDEFNDEFSEFDDEFGDFDDEFDYSYEAPTPQDFIDMFEDETGLSVPDDLVALMGDTFTLAIGAENLELIPQMQGPEDLEKISIAIHTSDGDSNTKAIDVMRKLADYATQNGIPLVAEESDGGAVLATSEAAAKAVAEGGNLGSSDRFKSVMPFGSDATFAFYLDIAGGIEKILEANPPEEIKSGIEEASFIEAIGMSAGNVDGHGQFSFRVSFTD